MGQSAQLAPAPPPVEGEPIPSDLCWLLSRASYILTTEMTAALEGVGVSPRAHCVLSADELESAGLAERKPSKTDRRARVIGVTNAGQRKVRQAEEIAERVRADVLDALPPADREVFLLSLTKLVSERLSAPVQCGQPVRRRAARR
jgi:MarR family transcriptional regulator for hemolysin